MVSLTNVSLVKTNYRLFTELNWTIGPAEHWVVTGPNGSGKSLLLRLLAGQLAPSSGEIRYDFIDRKDYTDKLEKIHYVPTHWLYAFIAGQSDIFYQQRYYSLEESEQVTVRTLLSKIGSELPTLWPALQGIFDVPLIRLSNGQLRKVILARQLSGAIPRLLLLDYPFDGLDRASCQELSTFIDDIASRLSVQIVMTTQGNILPRVINRKLVIRDFSIESTSTISQDSKREKTTTTTLPSTEITDVGEPVIELQDLSVRYGSRTIIANLNWTVRRGERWALTGPNGSGKTTLFSIIYADNPLAYSQKVFLFGRRRGSGDSIWDIKRRIGYLGPEIIHFSNHRFDISTPREFLCNNNEKHERVTELVSFFKIDKFIDLQMRFLSSGQLQMIYLINMLLDERELLLLDEPFQFLDQENHRLVSEFLQNRLSKHVTLVMITHDERDVMQWTHLRKELPGVNSR